MHQRLSRSNWPYCDSTYPDAFSGEKDSCGVGFIASVELKRNLFKNVERVGNKTMTIYSANTSSLNY